MTDSKPLKKIGFVQQFQYYFSLAHKKPPITKKPSIDLRLMHGMNRISIFLFLIALVILVIKLLR